MGLMDKLTAGIERVAEEADKAIDKGKAKVGEMQVELQMDGLAKKLGYLVFDFYRGREVDQALRQKILDDMSQLEEKLLQAKAEAAAKAEADAAFKAQQAAETAQPADTPFDAGASGAVAEAAEAATEAAEAAAEATVDAATEAAETVAAAPPTEAAPPTGV
jgi:hypothetical protein